MKSIADIPPINVIDLSGIDLILLVSLDALLAESNVTRAAMRLNLTQPAVSAQLARLRQLFDDPLLIPAANGRGMTPTARALELMAPLHAALKTLETVVRRESAFDPLTGTRRFVVAASDQCVAVLGLPLMTEWPRLAGPGLQLAFIAIESGSLAERFERGEIDLLLGSAQQVPPTLKSRKLYDERFVVAQRKRHPRSAAPFDLDGYCALGHVLVSTSGASFFGFMDEHLEALGRRRRVAHSVQHFTLVPEVLARTDYVATLPYRLIARYQDRVDLFELPFEARGFSMHAAWHPRNHADPALVWLREAVAALSTGSMVSDPLE
ncbi:LysR family transcriptional regulator [Paraburkholderia heleia]|uniref:LysR family transcriptional regulator n=1 Tax=Paraburkholderia heleia TaxID=634127 RepID=UPI000B12EDEE|nr:LysR family transcriptional regulator [Paraburkholderia heleia]